MPYPAACSKVFEYFFQENILLCSSTQVQNYFWPVWMSFFGPKVFWQNQNFLDMGQKTKFSIEK